MKNNLKCHIYLWGERIGELILINGKISLKYLSDEYEISPISLPKITKRYNFKENQLEGIFRDVLPDSSGMKILNSYFESSYPNFKANFIDKLLFIGDVSLGALEFKPAYNTIEKRNIAIDLKEAREYKKKLLLSKDYDSARKLIDVYKSFSPLAGARSKLLVNLDESNSKISIGYPNKNETQIILKIDESDSPIKRPFTTIEWIYSKVAREAKINFPKSYLLKDEFGYTHFGVKRFDVKNEDERYHIISLSGLLNASKYKRIDLKEFLEIAKSELHLPQQDIDEIFRRTVFNHVFKNHDDHLKNHEFLMDEDKSWRLSPAFDVTYNYSQNNSYMRTLINGKNSNKATLLDYLDIAKEFKVNEPLNIIKEVEDSYWLLKELVEKYMSCEYWNVDKEEILNVDLILSENVNVKEWNDLVKKAKQNPKTDLKLE